MMTPQVAIQILYTQTTKAPMEKALHDQCLAAAQVLAKYVAEKEEVKKEEEKAE